MTRIRAIMRTLKHGDILLSAKADKETITIRRFKQGVAEIPINRGGSVPQRIKEDTEAIVEYKIIKTVENGKIKQGVTTVGKFKGREQTFWQSEDEPTHIYSLIQTALWKSRGEWAASVGANRHSAVIIIPYEWNREKDKPEDLPYTMMSKIYNFPRKPGDLIPIEDRAWFTGIPDVTYYHYATKKDFFEKPKPKPSKLIEVEKPKLIPNESSIDNKDEDTVNSEELWKISRIEIIKGGRKYGRNQVVEYRMPNETIQMRIKKVNKSGQVRALVWPKNTLFSFDPSCACYSVGNARKHLKSNGLTVQIFGEKISDIDDKPEVEIVNAQDNKTIKNKEEEEKQEVSTANFNCPLSINTNLREYYEKILALFNIKKPPSGGDIQIEIEFLQILLSMKNDNSQKIIIGEDSLKKLIKKIAK